MNATAENIPGVMVKGNESDNALVSRFVDGDEQAFSTIVLRYQDRLVAVATGIVGDYDEAVDITQDAFMKAYFNLKGFRGASSLYTWLYRIVYNQCMSQLRRKKILTFLRLDSQIESENLTSDADDPSEEMERTAIQQEVQAALKQLPLRQRTVFVMKQIEGLKHEEIAEVMGITTGAVKASYFHAVRKLRSLLGHLGEAYEL